MVIPYRVHARAKWLIDPEYGSAAPPR